MDSSIDEDGLGPLAEVRGYRVMHEQSWWNDICTTLKEMTHFSAIYTRERSKKLW